jgi:hypothetical protein
VGLGPHVIDWTIVFGGDATVRFFRTWSSAHNPYDLWTRPPVS